MTTETVAGAKLVVDALVARGVEKIFTLSGGHITPTPWCWELAAVTSRGAQP